MYYVLQLLLFLFNELAPDVSDGDLNKPVWPTWAVGVLSGV
jgi:hypothetical protein